LFGRSLQHIFCTVYVLFDVLYGRLGNPQRRIHVQRGMLMFTETLRSVQSTYSIPIPFFFSLDHTSFSIYIGMFSYPMSAVNVESSAS
jgi:hypothetical protein